MTTKKARKPRRRKAPEPEEEAASEVHLHVTVEQPGGYDAPGLERAAEALRHEPPWVWV